MSRETGEPRWWVGDPANTRTCATLIAAHSPTGSTRLYTEAWQRDRGSQPCHATVRHGVQAWVQDADGDGRREGHGNTCEGAGAALRTSRRAFRGVQKRSLPLDVGTYEALVNTTRVTPTLIRRRCVRHLSAHHSYT